MHLISKLLNNDDLYAKSGKTKEIDIIILRALVFLSIYLMKLLKNISKYIEHLDNSIKMGS
jgi:hypothetical protein